MGLKEAINSIGSTITDLGELEVVTYTGQVNVVVLNDDGSINWNELRKGVKTSAALKLVAATQLKFDGDSYTFQTNEELPHIAEMLELHQQSIQNSLQTRKAIVDLFNDSFRNLVK